MIKILFLCHLVLLAQTKLPTGLKISIVPPEYQKPIEVYNGKSLSKLFDQSELPPLQSCTPPIFFDLGPNKDNSTVLILIENVGSTTQDIDSATIDNSLRGSLITVNVSLTNGYSLTIGPGQSTQFTVVHKCSGTPADYDSSNYWSLVRTKIVFNNDFQYLDIQYEFTCDSSYRVFHVDLSLLFLIIFSSFMVTILARFGMIYSFKLIQQKDQFTTVTFQGFQLNVWFLAVYGLLYLFIALSATMYVDQMRIPALLIVTMLGFLSCAFICNELLCVLPLQWGFKSEIYQGIRRCDILSVIAGLLIIFLYHFTQKVWYINDVIAICMMGVVVKLFKIQSLKAAVLILLPCALLDGVSAIVAHYVQTESYDILVLKQFNYPLELELPLFSLMFDKKCSWVSIINIILPGLVIGYNLRYDRTRNTNIYTVLSFVGLLGGSALWILVQVINRHSWPQSLFSYTLMILLTSIWAYKRGEWDVLWRGTFYDVQLMDPFNLRSKSQSYLDGAPPSTLNQLIKANQDQSKYTLDSSLYDGLHYTRIHSESEAEQHPEEKDQHSNSINSNV